MLYSGSGESGSTLAVVPGLGSDTGAAHMYWSDVTTYWRIGSSDALTSCNASRDYLEVVRMTRTKGQNSTITEFMDSAKSESCPSPDGAGCVGLWLEWDSDFRSRPWDGTFGWVENLGVTIVAG